ncbi:hypothetical protein JD276_02915 [Leucobacter sp. CSA1]|uniref:DUF559 domain-containing protein n=1 Tax=Leucobacter chromiisoli TaxID=2796471 RepID=A0A934Q5I7_9MICO|nr:hypothetical protein [Leucobacter chromiisoli]MBK0417986.1 hypothetical protein [Leucobacter chromiisoli]
MSTRSRTTDDDFADRPFLVREAVGFGYGPGTFVHPRWHRPFHGVRSKSPVAETLYGRALQYLPRLRPGERFSHLTALALLGCPIRVPKQAPVDISSPERMGRVTCRGATGHRHRSDAPEFSCAIPEHDYWIPVSPPLIAVLQSAAALPFRELVVALDHLLRRDPARYDQQVHVLPEELGRFAGSAMGRGVVRFREAAALARVGAESRMETLMRLAGVRVGMPELQVQFEVFDENGTWIGRFDAADVATRSLFEYDGEQHFSSPRQRRRDACKHQAARDAGWRLLVFFPEELVGRLPPSGRRMLEFSGRTQGRIRPALARLLDEVSGDDTESALPLPSRAAPFSPPR